MKWQLFLSLLAVATAVSSTSADLIITEVYAGVSGPDGTNEWFEIYNDMPTAQSITGLFFDDDSADPTVDDPIELVGGITSLNPGDTLIVFNDAGADATDEIAEFESFWGVSGLNYGFIDNGAGLNDGGDVVSVFDGNVAGANLVASLDYSSLTLGFATAVVDLSGPTVQGAAVGVLGAFASAQNAGTDPMPLVGSPGVVVPEPNAIVLVLLSCFGILIRRK